MGVGLITGLNYCLPGSVTIQYEHHDEHRKFVMLVCSMEDYSVLVGKQYTPSKSYPRLTRRLIIV